MEAVSIIAFREGLEAFLVLGIILAFLEKADLGMFKKYAWIGFILGVVLSVVLAVIFTVVVDGFESEELQYDISLTVLLFAIILLTYMIFWMKNNSDMTQMHKKIQLSNNQKIVTLFIVFSAILREGLETVLFTIAIVMDGQTSSLDVISGLFIGFSISAIIIWLLFKSSIKLPLGKFFQYSTYLILLIVAGLVSLLVKGLQAYEYIPTYIAPLFDISFFISNDSLVGRFLGVLVGYDATPSLLQVISWVSYIAFILILIFIKRKKDV